MTPDQRAEAARRDLAEVVEARRKFAAEMRAYTQKCQAAPGPHGSTSEVSVDEMRVDFTPPRFETVPLGSYVSFAAEEGDPNAYHVPGRLCVEVKASFHEASRIAVADKRRAVRLDGLRADHEGLKREIRDSDEARALRQLREKIDSLKTAWQAVDQKFGEAQAALDAVLLTGGDHRAADAALNEAEQERKRLARQVRLRLGPQSAADGPPFGPESPMYNWDAVPVLRRAEAAYANAAKATLKFWQQTQIAKSAAAEKAAREGLLEAVADRAIDLEAEQATQQLLNSHLYAQPEPPEIG
jgi:hypothetical protein